MPTIQSTELSKLCREIFEGLGTPPETAGKVVSSLVKSNLMGHDSHGVQLVLGYARRIRSGALGPTAEPEVERQTGAVAIVNGNWTFGQIVAQFGTALAADLAGEHGIGCVALSRSNHIGRLGQYAQMLADAGLVGMLMTGISRTEGVVAPYGGQERVYGTNPIAWGVPVDANRPPLILDFATSAVAYGKVALAMNKETAIPDHWLLDKNGHPTTDPQVILDDGVLMPFGLHKGGGLALMVELLTIGLAGQADGQLSNDYVGNPTIIVAYSIDAFVEPEYFPAYVESLLQRVKNTKAAPGFDEVLLPGEPEAHTEAERSRNGIPIPEKTWEALIGLAKEVGSGE